MYFKVCYSIGSNVDHVDKPNHKLHNHTQLHYCIIEIDKCYIPSIFLFLFTDTRQYFL